MTMRRREDGKRASIEETTYGTCCGGDGIRCFSTSIGRLEERVAGFGHNSQTTNGKRLNCQNAARIKKKSLNMIGCEHELVEMDLQAAFPLLCPLVLDCIIRRDVSEDSEG